jgi:hypothetical protein
MDLGGNRPQNLCGAFSRRAHREAAALANDDACRIGPETERLRMRQLLRQATLMTRMTIALLIVSFAFGAAGATSAPSKMQDCTGGASSVTAWVDASGTVHQSEPVTTGCIP